MSYRYEVDKDKAVRIWDDANPNEFNAPFILQPNWPDSTAWASKSEAESWAKAFIAALENPESEFIAGDTPSEPLKPRPVEETAASVPTE